MKCFYHNSDLDGHCSGAIIKHRYPDCKMIGINYGDGFPWDSIESGETVYMVDFSLQPWEDMQRLAGMVNLIWIDHHKSAIEEFLEYGLEAEIGTADGVAGCELTWVWIYLGELVPNVVTVLGRYDVWDHSDPDTLPFQYGMRLEDTNPENQALWNEAFTRSEFYERVLGNGHIILCYINQTNEKYISACAFDTELDGLRCIAVNRMLTNSQVFDSVWDPNQYDAMLTFGWRKSKWTVSLYSDKDDIDVSVIAKARGGGGHKGAAGFQCQELPFDLK